MSIENSSKSLAAAGKTALLATAAALQACATSIEETLKSFDGMAPGATVSGLPQMQETLSTVNMKMHEITRQLEVYMTDEERQKSNTLPPLA